MSDLRLDAYIDRGSVTQFTAQVTEAIPDSIAAALRAPDGSVLWSSSEHHDWAWRQYKPAIGRGIVCGHDCGVSGRIYDFKLRAGSSERLVLSVLVNAGTQIPEPDLLRMVKPALACFERQFSISATLSQKRRIPESLRKNLELLDSINQLRPLTSFAESLEQLASLCRDRLECAAVAVLLPNAHLQTFVPGSVNQDRQLIALLGKLMTRAKATQRILIADLPERLGPPERRQFLASPIIDPAGNVIGLFTAIGGTFTKDHVPIARSVSNKISVIAQQFSLPQRAFLLRDELIESIDRSLLRRPNSNHCLLYFDVDKTHLINDSFGYETGDKAIAKIGEIIRENAGEHQSLAHLMSDRFAVFLPEVTAEQAVARAEHIRELVARESVDHRNKALQLSVSVGIASAPDAARSGAELLTVAEVASRGAQERGGDQCAMFQPTDTSIIQRRSDADQVGYLQMALIENRFLLYAQRIESLHGNSPGGKYEVLVRLQHEDGSLIPPDKFLSAAERYQMMTSLDRWIIGRTLRYLADTSNGLEVNLATFCINISGQSLREVEFVEFIENAIAETGVSPDTLCFELTETAMVRNLDQAQRFVNRLQRLGCRIALDDFGTGYSSFAYLKHLPVQYLKVDGIFVRDLLDSPLSEAIVASVVSIAEVIGAATVAEHVENELVAHQLRMLGVDFIQGFHVHRPEPLTELLADLNRPGVEIAEAFEEVELGVQTR